MILLVFLLVAAGWSVLVALLLDRPDLAAAIPPPYQTAAHAAFALMLLVVVIRASIGEVRGNSSGARSVAIFLRNLVVIGLGVALMLFTCREILHGVDPTGTRHIFG